MCMMSCLFVAVGSKKLTLLQSGSADETHEEILQAFPKLREAGGYEIMRAGHSRQLEVVPNPADGYTTAYLKDIFGQAKVYIRPVQRDLTDYDATGSPISNSVSRSPDLMHGIFHVYTIGWTKGQMFQVWK